jgi:hypothetical protein
MLPSPRPLTRMDVSIASAQLPTATISPFWKRVNT